MAVWNMEHYCGEDLYSDGSVEDLIAVIVKEKLDYKNYAGIDDFYAVMYHLSLERENILNWYPFKKTDSILEVGSGCGALTGLLCEKAAWVTSVEISKKRAGINYMRHQTYQNLEIIVGNLNEIELGLCYDYIILNGVFEYAAGFWGAADPYESFLLYLKKYLKKCGKILIAIENRLGIKYFSGAMEDHTDAYYTGIKNYENISNVRTFSKGEIEAVFKKSDFTRWKYYYPYPDYKFPAEIFSDENVNAESFSRTYRNYQNGRVEIFNEQDLTETLKKENIMGSFANSFLIELLADDAEPCNIIYVKLNHARKKEYSIATLIKKVGKVYSVEKTFLDLAAKKHISNIYANQEKQLPGGFRYLHGSLKDDKIIYPYLSDKNLDVCFGEWMREGNLSEIKKHLDAICHSLLQISAMRNDFCKDAFADCFGNEKWNGQMECVKGCNIDLILDNIFWTGQEYIVIDPEWVFDFFIPVKFIFWRMLNEWYTKHSLASRLFPKEALYAEYGISFEMQQVFRRWAVYFATCYVSEADMDVYVQPSAAVDINQLLQEQRNKNRMEAALYIDYGQGFSEKDKLICNTAIDDSRFYVKFLLDQSRKIYGLRLDPVENRFCRCKIEMCLADEAAGNPCPVNCEEEDSSLFLNPDPQIWIDVKPGSYREIKLSGTFQEINGWEECLGKIDKLRAAHDALLKVKNKLNEECMLLQSEKETLHEELKEKNRLKEECMLLQSEKKMLYEELNAMKNSRGWKWICFCRRVLGGNYCRRR